MQASYAFDNLDGLEHKKGETTIHASELRILYPYTVERRDVLCMYASPTTKAAENQYILTTVCGHSLVTDPSFKGMCQEIHPFSVKNIDNVKIKTSLIMMRE